MRVGSTGVADTSSHAGASERIRAFRDIHRAIDELREEVKLGNRRERSWKKRSFAAGGIALLASVGLVVAISSSANQFYGISGETYSYDTSVFTLTSQGHSVGLTTAAAGATNSFSGASELAAANAGAANTAIVLGHWVFQATIAEAGVNTFAQSATAYYKLELFIDGTSQGSVYVKNAIGDALAAEGAVVKWDIGTNLSSGAAYVVKVTQVAA